MTHISKTTMLVAMLVLSSMVGLTQNLCSSAISISSLPYSNSATTCGSNHDYTISSCNEYSFYFDGEDYIYEYTAGTEGVIRAEITQSIGQHFSIAIYDGCPDAGGSCIASNSFEATSYDAQSTRLRTGVAEVTNGQTYYIVVSSYDYTTPCGAFTLDVYADLTIAGSTPSNAVSISSLPFSENNTTCGTGYNYKMVDNSSSYGSDSDYDGEQFFYTYTPVVNEEISIQLRNTNAGNLGILVYAGVPDYDDNTNCVGSSADQGNLSSDMTKTPLLSLTAGVTYYIVISSSEYNNILCSSFFIDINNCQAVGSSIANAEVIPSASIGSGIIFTDSESTCDACWNFELSGCGISTSSFDGEQYIYSWVPSTNMDINVDVTAVANEGRDMLIAVYQGDPSAGGTCVLGGDSDNNSTRARTGLLSVTAGQQYYIIITTDEYPTVCASFDLSINVCDLPGATCALAVDIPDLAGQTNATYTNSSTTCGACQNFFSPVYSWNERYVDNCVAYDFYADGEYFVYKYTPSTNDIINVNLDYGADGDMSLMVYDGCPSDPGSSCITGVYEGDEYLDLRARSREVSVTAGNTYYFLLSSANNSVRQNGCGAFTLEVTSCSLQGRSISTAETITSDIPSATLFTDSHTTCNSCPVTDQATGCGSNGDDFEGEQYYYIYTPVVDHKIEAELTVTSGYNGTISIYEGAPGSGNCVGTSANNIDVGQTDQTSEIDVSAGVTYYIIVSSDPSSSGINTFCVDYDLEVRKVCNVNALTISNPAAICIGEIMPTLSVTPSTGTSTIKWYKSATLDGSNYVTSGTEVATRKSGSQDENLTPGSPDIDPNSAGTTSFWVVEVIDGCEGPATQVDVEIKAVPRVPTSTGASYCVRETVSDLTVTGSGGVLTWYSDAGLTTQVGTGSPFTSTVNNSVGGTTSYYVTETSNGCEGSATQVDIEIKALPSAPTSSGASYCIGETVNDLTATGSGGTLTWYSDAGLTTQVGTGSPFTPTVNNSVAGTTTYYVTETVNGCEGSSTQVDIEIKALPNAPTSTGASYCVGETVSDLTATGSGGTLTWYSDGGLTTQVGTGSPFTPTVNNSVAGTTSYYVTETLNGCEGSSTQVDIEIKAVPVAPTVSGVTYYCASDAVSALTATSNGGTITWYDNANNIVATGISYTPALVTATYYVSETDNGCESASTQVDITAVNSPVDPIVTGNLEYCEGETITAINGATSGGTYSWYDSGNNLILSGPTFTPSISSVGVYNYSVSAMVGSCPTNSVAFSVEIKALPSAPTSTGASYCVGEIVNDLTSTGSGGTLTWYSDAGLTTQVGTGSPFTPTVNNSVSGTTTYYVTETSNGCEGSATQVDIEIKALPSAPTSSGASYCVGETVNDLTASGSGGTLAWYSDAGLITQVGTGSSFTPTVNNTVAGTTTYYVAETLNGCEGLATQVDVEIKALPSAPTSTGASYCVAETVNDLAATGSGGTLTWYSDAGLTTQVGTGSPFTPTVNNSVAGTTTYYVTETVNGCEGSSTQVDIEIKAAPNALTLYDVNYCQYSTVGPLTVLTSSGDVNWYADALRTQLIGTGSSVSSNLDNTVVGFTTFYAADEVNGCESALSSLTIEIKEKPSAPQANGESYCQGDVIADLTVSGVGSAFNWYSDAGLTNQVGANSPYGATIDNNTVGVTSFYVTEVVRSCEGDPTQVDIEVKANPDAPVLIGDFEYCDGVSFTAIQASSNFGSQYNWYQGSLLGTANSYTPNNLSVGTHSYEVRSESNGCESAATSFDIEVKLIPGSPNVSSPTPICETATFSPLVINGGAEYKWYNDVSMSSLIGVSNSYSPLTQNYSVWVSSTVDGCESLPTQIDFSIQEAPEAGDIGLIDYCNDNPDPINLFDVLTGVPDQGGVWRDDNDVVVAGGMFQVDPSVNTMTETFAFTYTVSGAAYCPDDQQTVYVFVGAKGNAGEDGVYAICENDDNVDLISFIQGADLNGVWTSPDGNNVNASSMMFDPKNDQPGDYIYTVAGESACDDVSAILKIFITKKPFVDFDLSKHDVCVDEPFDLKSTGESSLVASFKWEISNGDKMSKHDVRKYVISEPGVYDVSLTVDNVGLEGASCAETIKKEGVLAVHDVPEVSFSTEPERVSVLDASFEFLNESEKDSNTDYMWYFGDEDWSEEENPMHNYNEGVGEISIKLIVTDSVGCQDSTTRSVFLEPDFALHVPNAFTPNGDGVNDYFLPLAIEQGVIEYEMTVWNRLGELLFTSTDVSVGWNGHEHNNISYPMHQSGTYLYVIKVVDIHGVVHPDITGEVLLLK